MREAVFSIETIGDVQFSGYTDGHTWNGWACPFFPFEQAQRLVAAWIKNGWTAGYDIKQDAFLFALADSDAEQDSEIFGAVEVEGRRLYPIGNSSWIWDEVETQD